MDISLPPTRAVVLAAGRGRRLRPHTDRVPKPLLSVNGRPTLDFVMTSLSRAGVTDVCLVVQYLGQQIENYVGDGAQWGMRTSFRHQKEILGAAHAVKEAADFITQPTFILAADYLLPVDHLRQLKTTYLNEGSDLAVSLKRLSDREMSGRSSVRFDQNGAVVEIVEKPAPEDAPSNIGASMIFIIPSKVVDYLDGMKLSARGEYEFQSVVNRMLSDGYKITGLIQRVPPEWSPEENNDTEGQF